MTNQHTGPIPRYGAFFDVTGQPVRISGGRLIGSHELCLTAVLLTQVDRYLLHPSLGIEINR